MKTTSKRKDSMSFWEKVGESMSSRKWVWQCRQRKGEGGSLRDTLMSHSWHQLVVGPAIDGGGGGGGGNGKKH